MSDALKSHPLVLKFLSFENMKRTLARKICQQTSLLSGFGDTHGTSFVVEIFNKYLEIQDLNPFRLTVTDQAINDFVDFFLAQETGRLCQSEDASEEGSDLGDFIVEDSDIEEDAADFDEDSEEEDDFYRPVGKEGEDVVEDSEEEDTQAEAPSQPQHRRNSTFKELPFGAVPDGAVYECPAVASMSGLENQTGTHFPGHGRDLPCGPSDSSDLLDFANLRVFGNCSFRHQQRAVIEAVLQRQHCFVLMPTGGGKSLCYQLPAVVSRGVTVVVSPLLSLMQDQVSALTNLPGGGVPATFLSSQQSVAQKKAVFKELSQARPSCKLLYVTPEQLVKSQALVEILQRLDRRGLFSSLVIDEAHCVSSWGHDFRPEYKELGRVREASFSDVPTLAFTATATAKVKLDIERSLSIPNCSHFQVSFFRPNLTFKVVNKSKGSTPNGKPASLEALTKYIRKRGPHTSGIVYCLSRDESEQVSHYLQEQGSVRCSHYHAGMKPKDRIYVQNKWRQGELQVVVATIAFGMGIDKPDVRYVVHYVVSKSLEGYYQESGRAGRDGLPAECILMTAPKDYPRLIQLLRKGGRAGRSKFQLGMDLLNQMKGFCEDQETCRHVQLLRYFGETLSSEACKNKCDNCLRKAGQKHDPDWPELVTTKSGKVKKTGEKGGEGSSKRKKARKSAAASKADGADDVNGEKENHGQGFISAANFLGKEKAAPPTRKLPGHFFKRNKA